MYEIWIHEDFWNQNTLGLDPDSVLVHHSVRSLEQQAFQVFTHEAIVRS
jgi:hypothetical protein